MKKSCLPILLLTLCLVLVAQKKDKPQTLTAAQIQSTSMTVADLVGLKAKYEVISCGIDYTRLENGMEMEVMGGGICVKSIRIQPCTKDNAHTFSIEWANVAPKVAKGQTIYVSYTYIKKGDELQMYYGSKEFIVP